MKAALMCLALNAYFEARSEPFEGQVAVSQVVLRRAQHDEKKVCKVVYRQDQFSWTSEPRRKPTDRVAWQRAVQAAKVAMLWSMGAPIRDYSAGADHYHAMSVYPAWSDKMQWTTTLGDHHFYDSRKSSGVARPPRARPRPRLCS